MHRVRATSAWGKGRAADYRESRLRGRSDPRRALDLTYALRRKKSQANRLATTRERKLT